MLTKNNDLFLIEEAFSIRALIFQVFWLIYHGLWRHVAIFVLVYLCSILLFNLGIMEASLLIKFELISSLIIATFAKTWLIQKLKNNNFNFSGVVVAKNIEEAKLKFFESKAKE